MFLSNRCSQISLYSAQRSFTGNISGGYYSLTSLSISDTNSFRDAFNDEIIFIASFVQNCFSSTIFFKAFI